MTTLPPHSYRILTGPTAAGKTGWLLRRAQRTPLVVISADSRQVYRGMDIGTGKATPEEQQTLTHFGLDLANPLEKLSVFSYLIYTSDWLSELESYQGEVWFCGGTGLYLRAVAEGLQLGAPPLVALRPWLQAAIERLGAIEVSRLCGLRLADPANPRRVLRALEGLVHQSAGTENLEACLGPVPANARAELSKLDSIGLEVMSSKPDTDRLPRQVSCLLDTNVESMEYIPHKKYSLEDMSSAHGQLRTSGRWACGGLYVLDPGRDELAARIARRVRGMFAGGLLQEAAELRRAGQGEAEVVCEGIGYREALAVLDGTLAEEDAVERTIVRTRQYAKRQRTYFRGRGWPVFTGPELDAALQQSSGG